MGQVKHKLSEAIMSGTLIAKNFHRRNNNFFHKRIYYNKVTRGNQNKNYIRFIMSLLGSGSRHSGCYK